MPSYPEAVLVAAPATLHRQGLLAILRETCPSLSVVLAAESAALPALLLHPYALLIVDAHTLPVALPPIGRRQPVLCFTATGQPWPAAGPCTLLAHNTPPTEVGRAIRALLRHDDEPPPRAGRGPSGPPTPFSRRELEVLRLVVGDLCNQEIADTLCLSVRTVESHRRALLQKAGARTLVGLAVQAVRQGWVAAG